MIDALTGLFKSMTKSLDVLYVMEGAKDVSRIMASDDDINGYKDFLIKQGMSFAVSDFKVSKEVDQNRFSNKGIRLPKTSQGYYLVYISKSKGKAEQAKEAEKENNHKRLGRLLGYPECCIRFFDKEFPKQSKKSNDYVLASLSSSKGFVFPFYNNIAARQFDLSLISHFPCSLDCKSSISIAKRNLRIIKKHSAEISKIFEGMLKSAVLYTEDRGAFLLRDFKLEGNKLSYDKIMSHADNVLYQELKDSKHIEIVDKNTVNIRDKNIDNVGVMIFL